MSLILEITDGRGNLRPSAPLAVFATMSFSNDPEKRRNYQEVFAAKLLLDGGAPMSKDRANHAASLAAQFESVANSASESSYGVRVAGDLLLFIINASLYSPKDASVARAVRVWSADQAVSRTDNGRSVPASPRSIRGAWAIFKPVAHLCAAHRLRQNEELSESSPEDFEQLTNFLAVAEALRKFGEWHHPPSGRTGSKSHDSSTLDPETTWRTPSDLVLPGMPFRVPPLTEFASRILQHYRAE